ncbi:MAG: TonB-dependent receptor [Saprospirales bacterium]|nr:TonB-dependent receptor [Saprospirales bacterium]MBK8921042.1 TonB-dependent receptor [Saprospirales bacterium]
MVTFRFVWRFGRIAFLLAAGTPFFNLNAQNRPDLPDSAFLKTVVIQATRTGANSPVPHSNISAEKIGMRYQVQDIPFLLTGIPSLVESSDAGAGTGYTGMRIRGSDPTRINVTLNGIPLNDAESQGVFWVDMPDLAASAAEIQVQRGVGASTNGAGSFGATVNLDLSRVATEPYALITNSAGSFATRKHCLSLGTGLIRNRLAFSGRLSKIASAGYVDRADANLQSYHLSGTYIDDRQSVQLHLLSGHEVTYQAWNGLPAQYLEVDSLQTYNSAGTEQPGLPYPNEVDDYAQRHYLLHLKRLFSHGFNLQINGHYTRGFGFYEQYKAGAAYSQYGLPNPVIGGVPIQSTDLIRKLWLDNHFYGGTFALQWIPLINPPNLTAAPQLMLGGAFNRYEGRHYGEVIWAGQAIPKGYRFYDNTADKRDANVYGKFDLSFRHGLSLMLDVQYRLVQYSFLGFDRDQNNVEQTVRLQFLNPKAGVRWLFHPDWTAYAFFGVGQREPNRDDYTQSTPQSRPRAERLFDWEGGLKTQRGRVTAAINWFFMHYRDQLALDGRINDVGAYIRTNVPRSYRAGLETELAFQLSPNLIFSGNAALSRNKVPEFVEYRDNWDTGAQETYLFRNTDLAFSPGIVARAEAVWYLFPVAKKQQLAVTLSAKYVGKQYLDNTANPLTALPAYVFADLRLNYDLHNVIGESLRAILSVNNVLNARYISNGWVYRYVSQGYDERPHNPYARLEGNGVYHQAGFFPQAGRNVMATLTLEF